MSDAGRLSRVTRRLGVVVGGGFFALGVVELIMRLEKPLVLLFWLPTLWGGAALVLAGVFFLRTARGQLAVVFMILGAFLGSLASAWTVLMPILALLLVILTIVGANRREPQRDTAGPPQADDPSASAVPAPYPESLGT